MSHRAGDRFIEAMYPGTGEHLLCVDITQFPVGSTKGHIVLIDGVAFCVANRVTVKDWQNITDADIARLFLGKPWRKVKK